MCGSRCGSSEFSSPSHIETDGNTSTSWPAAEMTLLAELPASLNRPTLIVHAPQSMQSRQSSVAPSTQPPSPPPPTPASPALLNENGNSCSSSSMGSNKFSDASAMLLLTESDIDLPSSSGSTLLGRCSRNALATPDALTPTPSTAADFPSIGIGTDSGIGTNSSTNTPTNANGAPHHHRAIDMDLLNRWTLDSEISGLLHHRPQFANQLLYCQNRTSSIYTDSSDDISSLAGSDSLLWDDHRGGSGSAGGSSVHSYTPFPSARSAQIAQIVEYFERKGQTFRPGTWAVPDSFRSSPVSSTASSSTASSIGGAAPLSTTSGAGAAGSGHPHGTASSSLFGGANEFGTATTAAMQQHHSHFYGAAAEFPHAAFQFNANARRSNSCLRMRAAAACTPTGAAAHPAGGGAAAVAAADYEAFCLELDKRPQQQRIMVCEGAVRSKLQIFDKMTSKATPQPQQSGGATDIETKTSSE